jgi:hypothetical protein
MPPVTLNPALKDRYTREYLETLDRIDNLRTELKEEVKERKGEIAALEKGAFRLRRLLAGKTEEQTEIPGAEVPQVAPRKGVTAITLTTGDGKAITATPERMSAAIDEINRRKGRKARSEP